MSNIFGELHTELKLDSIGEAETNDADDGDSTTTESYKLFFASSNFQWVLSPKAALDLNLMLGNTGKISYKFLDGSTIKYDSKITFGIGGTANIILKNKYYLIINLSIYTVKDRNVSIGVIKQF